MSNHIPFEIQIEIMKLLPIKSLVQFRSVSKQWKSVIDSSDFIADYTVRSHSHPHPLLIRYQNPSSDEQYVSIADDDTDTPTVPPSVNLLRDSIIVGTSHGLICVIGSYLNPHHFQNESATAMAVVWNPSIRKSVAVAIDVPDIVDWPDFGFGVSPATCEAKMVKISKSVTWRVEVFSLTWQVWRASPCYPPDKLVKFSWPQSPVALDGFIYWIGLGSGFNFVISFNLLSEEFGDIHLPATLAVHDPVELYLFNRRNSLAVVRRSIVNKTYELWMMENGAFKKLFTVNMPNGFLSTLSLPLEFRVNGEFMMATYDADDSEQLVVYEPLSGRINDVGIKGRRNSLLVSSYTKSIILLDQ